MKDLHSHVLYGIDDGSKDYNSSVTILNELYNSGITDLVLTPHYIHGTTYSANNIKKKEILDTLQKETKINLYVGNEVYIDNNILEYINNNNVFTINNSRYILIELPMYEELKNTSNILFKLIDNGIIPIIAHPERYDLSYEYLEGLINMGCLMQGNITSLSGKYGRSIKKKLVKLLKKHMIHVLGTDTHSNGNIDIKSLTKELTSIVGSDMCNDLLYNNFDKIINNEIVTIYKVK